MGPVLAEQRRPAPAMPDPRLAALLDDCSFEIAPHDELAGDGLCDFFAPGRTVFVGHPPSASHHAIVAACARLRRAGFVAVPHVAARRLAGFTQARDFLERAAAAGVERALLVGGDPERPAGPFAGAADLLRCGLVEQSGIREVAFAGYPEGHPRIAGAMLDRALADKLLLARQRALAASIVTQFGFNAGPVRRYVDRVRARGIDCPVQVGLAGPADVATLATFAVRCGVGASLRAFAPGHSSFARILTEAAPETLLSGLLAEGSGAPPVLAVHLFTFGGVRRTAEWLRSFARNR